VLTGTVEQVVHGTFNQFAALVARSGGTEVGAALALGSLVAFAAAELLLGKHPSTPTAKTSSPHGSRW
jgi:hypothetical protein